VSEEGVFLPKVYLANADIHINHLYVKNIYIGTGTTPTHKQRPTSPSTPNTHLFCFFFTHTNNKHSREKTCQSIRKPQPQNRKKDLFFLLFIFIEQKKKKKHNDIYTYVCMPSNNKKRNENDEIILFIS